MNKLLLIMGMGMALTGLSDVYAPDFQKGKYDVHPSAIVPRWSGAEPGEWTFDYKAAFSNARAEGRYTLLLFSAMWWCPHCQPLESRVLVKDAFQSFVDKKGLYLTVVDFPYRDGLKNWCWLWDSDYREANGIGDWTPLEVSDELIRRFQFQDSWSKNGATTVNQNVLVRISHGTTNLVTRTDIPTTTYHRVGYPTIIVVKPNGKEAGRFTFNKTVSEATAVDYVVENIRSILLKDNAFSSGEDSESSGLSGTAASQYVGWLKDVETGVVGGTFTIKTGKGNRKTGVAKVTASFQPALGKKVSLSGSVVTPCTNSVVELTKNNMAATAQVTLSENGLMGSFTDAAGKTYVLQGGRNVFTAKDGDAKTRAAALKTGFWTFALTNGVAVGEGSAFANGSGGLSVEIKAKGKAKVSGYLGDGTKMNVSAQGVMGDDGMFAVPVCASLYSKKGGVSFVLHFKDGLLNEVTGVSDWIAAGKNPFGAVCGIKHGSSVGAGALAAEGVRFELDGLTLSDYGIADEYLGVEFTPSGKKWKSAGVSDETLTPFDFSLSYADKTGLFKGTLTVAVKDAKGKTKKVKAKVYGALVGGIGEGTAVFPKIGSWKIRIVSACGGEGC